MIDLATQFFGCNKSELIERLLAKRDCSKELRQFIDLIKRNFIHSYVLILEKILKKELNPIFRLQSNTNTFGL